MTLDALLATNVFSHTAGAVRREYVPFNEALTAQSFAEAINSGKMSVEDAWRHYWSYEEDAKFWGLPEDREWRALLPAWESVLATVILGLHQTERLVHLLCDEWLYAEPIVARTRPYRIKHNPLFAHRLLLQRAAQEDERIMTMYCRRLLHHFTDVPNWPDELMESVGRNQWYQLPYAVDPLIDGPHTTLEAFSCLIQSIVPCDSLLASAALAKSGTACDIRRYAQLSEHVTQPQWRYIEHYGVTLVFPMIHNRLKPQGYNPAVKKLVLAV